MTSNIVPLHTPTKDYRSVLDILHRAGITDGVALLGYRGFFSTDGNERGIYDDAIFLVSPTCYLSFNANCDPSLFRKGIATLKPGLWFYKLGTHGLSKPKAQQYRALVQAKPVQVERDGLPGDTGWFGINIHRGSRNRTSSEGCQTIPPDQWTSFIATVEVQMKKHGQKVIPYLLIERGV